MKKGQNVGLAILGILSAMALVACNVDPDRVDKDVENTIKKKMCASPHRLNLETIEANRVEKLGQSDTARVRSLFISSSEDAAFTTASMVDVQSERIDLQMNCSDLTASLNHPMMKMDQLRIESVDTHEIVLVSQVPGDDTKATIKTEGVAVPMTKIEQEDGINQIRVEVSSSAFGESTLINETVMQATDRMIISDADAALMTGAAGIQVQSTDMMTASTGQKMLTSDYLKSLGDEGSLFGLDISWDWLPSFGKDSSESEKSEN